MHFHSVSLSLSVSSCLSPHPTIYIKSFHLSLCHIPHRHANKIALQQILRYSFSDRPYEGPVQFVNQDVTFYENEIVVFDGVLSAKKQL